MIALTNTIHDKKVRLPVIISILLNCSIWAYIFFSLGSHSDILYLHYNIYYGVDLIGPWARIYILPAAGLSLVIINFLLALFTHKRSANLAMMIGYCTILQQIILLVASYLIIELNA
ncbi:MAG: hypothetical protein PHY34_01505 [Patescibacteria group bacterium]|nr:hypothetical protein [Patescibacteria group bacterium]MDD5715103.1 hypothetical protein [Patescibacteria group bacterium]